MLIYFISFSFIFFQPSCAIKGTYMRLLLGKPTQLRASCTEERSLLSEERSPKPVSVILSFMFWYEL